MIPIMKEEFYKYVDEMASLNLLEEKGGFLRINPMFAKEYNDMLLKPEVHKEFCQMDDLINFRTFTISLTIVKMAKEIKITKLQRMTDIMDCLVIYFNNKDQKYR